MTDMTVDELLCRLIGFSEPEDSIWSGLENGFDWDLFFERVELNACVPLAYWRLEKAFHSSYLTEEAFARVSRRWADPVRGFERQARSREEWVRRLLRESEVRGIEVILLKGSLLGAAVYPKFSYKKMNDVDVLVRQEEVLDFLAMIRDLGFRSVGALFDFEEISEKNHHTSPQYSPDLSCLLGIHWNLCSPYAKWKPDVEELWRSKQKLDCLGENAFRLGWEENLAHLCIHLPFFKVGARELADVSNLVNFLGDSFDWEKFAGLIEAWRADEAAYRVLVLAHRLIPFPVPAGLFDQWRERSPADVVRDTRLRASSLSLLLTSRSTHIAKIEKAYSVSRCSPDPTERLQAWAKTWSLTFFPPANELRKWAMVSPEDRAGWLKARIRAPGLAISAMSRDYGVLAFWVITGLNALQALKSLGLILRGIKKERMSENHELKLLASLE